MRRGLVVGMAVLTVLLSAAVAQACSCADGDPRSSLARADGAFVGTVVRAPDRTGSDQEVSWEFAVERVVKGDLRERVTVWSSANGASCGLEIRDRRRIGLFLERHGERWASSLCWQVDPDRLLAAVDPLPAADGVGPAAFVVGGQFGGSGVIALDEQGRTLAYGAARDGVWGLSVCPGGSRVAALSMLEGGGAAATVYDLPGLGVVRTRELRQAASWPMALGCGDPAGDDLFVFFEKPADQQSTLTLYRLRRDDTPAVVWMGPGSVPVFDRGGRFAVVPVHEPPSLTVVELPGGRSRPLAALPERASRLAVHPSGRSVLVLAADWREAAPPARLFVIGLDGRRIAERELGAVEGGSAFLWSGDSQVTVSTVQNRVETFDGRLRPKGAWDGPEGIVSTERAGHIYVMDHEGRIHRGSATSGGLRLFRDLPDGRVTALLTVPPVDGPAPATTTTTTTTAVTTTPTPTTAVPSEPPELAAEPASSTDDPDAPGALAAGAVLALLATASAVRLVVVRRRLRRA